MCYPTLRHPYRYVWDFWYWYEADAERFHLFYLNAPPDSVSQGWHHQLATVGYGVTADFTTIEWGPYDVLVADPGGWDNTSIWTGDVVRIGEGFLLFYTSRDRNWGDGYTQAIGIAAAATIDACHWQRTVISPLVATTAAYARGSVLGDPTVHAWRDPFLFRQGGDSYMLLSAKATGLAPGRNGAIAWLRADGNQLSQWQPLPPLVAPGYYAEMEVPQLYGHADGSYEVVFSSTAALDFGPRTDQQGGVQGMTITSLEPVAAAAIHLWLPAASDLYACRVIPELDGELVGFDLKTGGIRRSGLKTHLQSVNRDFSGCTLADEGEAVTPES